MGRRCWNKASCFFLTCVVFMSVSFILPSTEAAAAVDTIGIVGITDRTHGAKNSNLGNYTNLDHTRDPMQFAQGVFSEILATELPLMDLKPLDMSERATQARIDEMTFQLDLGKPDKVLANFAVKPDYLIYGYISNFTATHREVMGTNNISVEVRLSVRVVDASTGKVVFVATGKGISATHNTSAAKGFRFSGEEISEEAWHESLEKALTEIAEKTKKAI